MWSRWVFTVASEMKSRAAAPRLVSPRAISVNTSSCNRPPPEGTPWTRFATPGANEGVG
jgi:hypothetical protein